MHSQLQLPLLTLPPHQSANVKWVSSTVKLCNLLGMVEVCAAKTDNQVLVGVDAEWADSGRIQTLQLSCLFYSHSHRAEGISAGGCAGDDDVNAAKPLNYVIDCGKAWDVMDGTKVESSDSDSDRSYPIAMKDFLSKLFNEPSNGAIVVIGFSFHNDKPKLRELYEALQQFKGLEIKSESLIDKLSFPHLVDLQNPINYKHFVLGQQPGYTMGLRTLCREVLGRDLDKTFQCSDWAARPLSGDQLTYAALDADVLVRIYLKLRLATSNNIVEVGGKK